MTIAVKNDNKTPLVIPRAARQKAGFKSGQELEIKASGGVITIIPKVQSARDESTIGERRSIDRGIVASEKDYREGKAFGPFKTREEFLASLHTEASKLRGKRK